MRAFRVGRDWRLPVLQGSRSDMDELKIVARALNLVTGEFTRTLFSLFRPRMVEEEANAKPALKILALSVSP
jgi:hypothetical protein